MRLWWGCPCRQPALSQSKPRSAASSQSGWQRLRRPGRAAARRGGGRMVEHFVAMFAGISKLNKKPT